ITAALLLAQCLGKGDAAIRRRHPRQESGKERQALLEPARIKTRRVYAAQQPVRLGLHHDIEDGVAAPEPCPGSGIAVASRPVVGLPGKEASPPRRYGTYGLLFARFLV